MYLWNQLVEIFIDRHGVSHHMLCRGDWLCGLIRRLICCCIIDCYHNFIVFFTAQRYMTGDRLTHLRIVSTSLESFSCSLAYQMNIWVSSSTRMGCQRFVTILTASSIACLSSSVRGPQPCCCSYHWTCSSLLLNFLSSIGLIFMFI